MFLYPRYNFPILPTCLKPMFIKHYISGTRLLQSIWKLKKNATYMIMRIGNSIDDLELSEQFELVIEFYTFSNDVGYGTEAFSVSKPDNIPIHNRRFVQKGQDVLSEEQTHQYNFWALPKWQPGLMVFY